MSDKPRPIRLNSETHRAFVASLVLSTPVGHFISITPPTRGLKQNDAIHGKLRDIAEQVEWHGRKLTVDIWKRLCMAAWLREEGEAPDLVPALDGNGFDVIYNHTSKLTIAQASRFLEWISAFGAEHGVKFNDQA